MFIPLFGCLNESPVSLTTSVLLYLYMLYIYVYTDAAARQRLSSFLIILIDLLFLHSYASSWTYLYPSRETYPTDENCQRDSYLLCKLILLKLSALDEVLQEREEGYVPVYVHVVLARVYLIQDVKVVLFRVCQPLNCLGVLVVVLQEGSNVVYVLWLSERLSVYGTHQLAVMVLIYGIQLEPHPVLPIAGK